MVARKKIKTTESDRWFDRTTGERLIPVQIWVKSSEHEQLINLAVKDDRSLNVYCKRLLLAPLKKGRQGVSK